MALETGNTQLTGRFRRCWQVLCLAQRKPGQRFTEPLGPIRSYAPDPRRLR